MSWACRDLALWLLSPLQYLRRLVAQKALQAAFKAVDEDSLLTARRDADPSGSTAVVALRLNCCVAVAHVGDSRAVLCQKDPPNSSAPGESQLFMLLQSNSLNKCLLICRL